VRYTDTDNVNSFEQIVRFSLHWSVRRSLKHFRIILGKNKWSSLCS